MMTEPPIAQTYPSEAPNTQPAEAAVFEQPTESYPQQLSAEAAQPDYTEQAAAVIEQPVSSEISSETFGFAEQNSAAQSVYNSEVGYSEPADVNAQTPEQQAAFNDSQQNTLDQQQDAFNSQQAAFDQQQSAFDSQQAAFDQQQSPSCRSFPAALCRISPKPALIGNGQKRRFCPDFSGLFFVFGGEGN